MVNLKRTREDILSAVMGLIYQQGFQATSLKELCAISGSSPGSFYNYFASKDDLAHALIDYKWQQMKDSLIEPAKKSPDAIAGLFQMIDLLEKKHLAEPNCAGCFLGNLIVELVEHDPSFREHLVRVFDEWQLEILTFLKAGRSHLRQNVNPEQLAEQLLMQIEGVLLLNRLYHQHTQLKRGFDGVRQTLRNALQG